MTQDLAEQINDMAKGLVEPSSALYARMLEAANSMRRFDDRFELFSLDALRGRIDLLDHQLAAAKTVISAMQGRAILADEVGLGKTIEAGIVAKELQVRGRLDSLFVACPATLIPQWIDEFEEKFDIKLHHVQDHDNWTLEQNPFWIANSRSWYSANSRYRDMIMDRTWDMVILDEAHQFRNRATKGYKALAGVGYRGLQSKNRLLLTATPIQNDLKELYALLHLVRPGALGSFGQFKKRYFADSRGQEVSDAENLRSLVRGNMIRRRRIECGVDYTRRQPQIHHLDAPPGLSDLYQQVLDTDRLEGLQKTSLLRLAASSAAAFRRSVDVNQPVLANDPGWRTAMESMRATEVAGEPKLKTLVEIAEGRHGHDEPRHIVSFATYLATIDSFGRSLEDEGCLVHRLTGRLSVAERRQLLRDFKRQGGIFIATKAGTEGINLQFANVIVNLDLPWNPMEVEQRIGRVHRLGQDRDVHVHTMAYRGTIEDLVLGTLYRKLELFRMSVGEIDAVLTTQDQDFQLQAFLEGMVRERASLQNIRARLENITDKRGTSNEPSTLLEVVT